MKIDEYLLKFPKFLPNDLEGLMFYYPEKFPLIVSDFEEIAPKIAGDAEEFRKYADWTSKELWQAFEKVNADYQEGNQKDLDFLITTDQRFQKLYCYRFWIVNYLFPDGPIHDLIVDNLKNLIRKFIDVTEEIEDFENKVIRIQRDLLQSDYADLYLMQALNGVELVKLLGKNPKTNTFLLQAQNLIDKHSTQDVKAINEIWDKVVAIVEDKSDPQSVALREKLETPIEQAKMRSSMLPIYNMLTHAVEFRSENESLLKRNEEMGAIIDGLKAQAKEKLTPEEYDLFIFSYEQARNFSMYKDVMGAIDPALLPVWFGLHTKIKEILIAQGSNIRLRPTGPTAVIHHLVWYLPSELKAKVMTPDFTPFSLETL